MSIQIEKTVVVIPDRVCRIFLEKPYGGVPNIMTVDESIVDGVHSVTGNMTSTYDASDPIDVALYAAMEAKVLSMRAKRDNKESL